MKRALAAVAGALLAIAGCAGPGSGGGATAEPVGRSSTDASAQSTQVSGLPTQAELATARADVEKLSTARLAAQLVVPRRENDAAAAAALVRDAGFGGVALFAEHVPDDPRALVSTVTRANTMIGEAVGEDRGWPAFVAVDQEGGPVERIGAPLTRFGSAMGLGATGDAGLARRVGSASGSELAKLGFTVVLAPDADVTSGPDETTIGARSPGSDPQLVANIATGYSLGYADAGLVAVAKHFPGHGTVTGDTHDRVVHQTAHLERLLGHDLVPFSTLVGAGVPAIMTAHIVVDALDGATPATLSTPVLTGMLRERLGFDGLIVTDALEMGAVAGGEEPGEAAVRAVEAGADVLLMPTDPRAAATALARAVDSGRLTRDRLAESAARMVATLRHASERATVAPTAAGSHHDLALEVARRSITQLPGKCGARLVGDGISVTGGTQADRMALNAAAREAGVKVGTGTVVTLVGGGPYRAAEGSGTPAGTDAALAGVTVALDVPYVLQHAPGPALAAYGRTPATFAALVDVLTGKRTAEGALPVAVGSHPPGAGCGERR